MEFHINKNIGDIMALAMAVESKKEAIEFVDALVRFSLRWYALRGAEAGQPTREKAIEKSKRNISYWYHRFCGRESRAIELFECHKEGELTMDNGTPKREIEKEGLQKGEGFIRSSVMLAIIARAEETEGFEVGLRDILFMLRPDWTQVSESIIGQIKNAIDEDKKKIEEIESLKGQLRAAHMLVKQLDRARDYYVAKEEELKDLCDKVALNFNLFSHRPEEEQKLIIYGVHWALDCVIAAIKGQAASLKSLAREE